jgi:hypothetical protein
METPSNTDAETYCREIEAYLCRKNDGHLVRVVGPAFNVVSGWWSRGIPFKVACRGIDRYFERYYAKGPRRRPVRIEFCDADVLDVFDEWRRALGLGMAGLASAADAAPAGLAVEPGEGGEAPKPRSEGSLRSHLDRVVTRLTDLQARGGISPPVAAKVEELIEYLGSQREASRTLRGEARQALVARLAERDRELLEAATASTPRDVLASLDGEAAQELAGFRARMAPEAYERALGAAARRLLRERLKLPVITYEQA